MFPKAPLCESQRFNLSSDIYNSVTPMIVLIPINNSDNSTMMKAKK
jgi:hypothetical protein